MPCVRDSQIDEAHQGDKKDADSSKSQHYTFFDIEQRNDMVRTRQVLRVEYFRC